MPIEALTERQVAEALDALRDSLRTVERVLATPEVGEAEGPTDYQRFLAVRKKRAIEDAIGDLERRLGTITSRGVLGAAADATAESRALATSAGASGPAVAIDPHVVAYAQATAADEVVAVTDQMRTALRRAVTKSLAGGYTRSEFEGEIRRILGDEGSRARVERIVRTEIGRAHEQTKAAHDEVLDDLGLDLVKRWITTGGQVGDGRTRPDHAAIHGQERELDEPFHVGGGATAGTAPHDAPAGAEACNGPLDPVLSPEQAIQCFPAGTLVSGLFDAGLRALYSGEVVEVSTKGGRRLTVTANHPVATVDGFAPARALRKGDRVLCHGAVPHPSTSVLQHEENAPAAIEQVLRALAESRNVVRVDLLPVDLHGDAESVEGQVDVVRADRELRDGGDAARAEVAGDPALVPSDVDLRPLPLLGARAEFAHGHPPTARSGPRPAALALDESPVATHRGPLQPLRVGSAANLDASRYEPTGEGRTRDPEFLREMLQRFPGEVSTDEIVLVEVRPFRGHVYDLQSPRGWIAANGIVASNCRCTVVRVPRAEAVQPYIAKPQPVPAT